MRMFTSYHRLQVSTGHIEELPFADCDGQKFGVYFERGEGVVFTHDIALAIVNDWNSRVEFISPHFQCVYWIK